MKANDILSLPNLLTLIRLLAIPVMARLIYVGEPYVLLAFVLFLCIWLTDMLDGYMARRLNQVTEFGKVFDPFVDKVFQLTVAITMYCIGKLPLWVPVVIAVKESFLMVGGLTLLKRSGAVIPARWYGKAATILFVIAFATLFFLPAEAYFLTDYIFIPPVLLSLFACVQYGISFLKIIKEHPQETAGNDS